MTAHGENGMDRDFSGLFQIYQHEPHSFRQDARKIVAWLGKRQTSFSFFLTVSAVLHVFSLGFLLVSDYSVWTRKRAAGLVDLQVILSALGQRNEAPAGEKASPRPLTQAEEDEVLGILSRMRLFAPSLTGKEKIELAKRLIEAYLTLKDEGRGPAAGLRISLDDLVAFLEAEGAFGLSDGERAYSAGRFAGPESPAFYKADKSSQRQLRFLRRFEKSEREGTPVVAGTVRVTSEFGERHVPSEYYFRECPYEEILARGVSLFYVVSGFPDLDGKPSPEPLSRPGLDLAPAPLNKADLVIYILKSSELNQASPLPATPRPALRISADESREILDGLMALPEEEQFACFVDDYLQKFDPDEGDLARLTQEYVYNNLSVVFVFEDTFAAAFDFLEELFYNKESQGYFSAFWNEHPRTKTGAEFLLILASLYDFEKRTLGYIFDSYDVAKKILAGETRFQRAFNQKAKAFVLKEMCEGLAREMAERGLKTEEDLFRRYRDEQEKIYRLLLDMGGEEKNRALYALGRVYWDEGMSGAAIQEWKEVDGAFASRTFREIRNLIKTYEGGSTPFMADYRGLVPEINRVFERESTENSNALLKRLLRFHKWEKRGPRAAAPGGSQVYLP
jgi:hypothetical protein